jgi:hypothetical protein
LNKLTQLNKDIQAEKEKDKSTKVVEIEVITKELIQLKKERDQKQKIKDT